MTRKGTCQSLALLLLSASAALAQSAYDFGNPSPIAQEILEYANRARSNPAAEAVRLVETQDSSVRNAYTFFEVDLDVFTNEMNQIAPKPPLAWSAALINAAAAHSQRMADNDEQTHARPGGISLLKDFENHGYDLSQLGGRVGENVFAYAEGAWHSHAGWMVDWGYADLNDDGYVDVDDQGNPVKSVDGMQTSRGHRKNILNEPTQFNPQGLPYREVGIAIVAEDNPQTTVGPLVITQEFGTRGSLNFLTGVVYNDLDGDQTYDAGEGVSGVEIRLSEGDWYAVTTESGGYTIPIYGLTGAVTITATGGDLEDSMSLRVVLTEENRKVDIRNGVFIDGGAFGGPWNFVQGADQGWSKSSWFDWVYLHPDQWVFHPMFGRFYYWGTSNSMALYDGALGWLWTSQHTFPFFYQYESGRWLFWYQSTPWPGRWFHVVEQDGTSVGDFHEQDL